MHASMGNHTKLLKRKNGVQLPHKENLNFRGHITTYPHIYKNVILPLRITKMSFYHSELQKCHTTTHNYKKCHYRLKMVA